MLEGWKIGWIAIGLGGGSIFQTSDIYTSRLIHNRVRSSRKPKALKASTPSGW